MSSARQNRKRPNEVDKESHLIVNWTRVNEKGETEIVRSFAQGRFLGKVRINLNINRGDLLVAMNFKILRQKK